MKILDQVSQLVPHSLSRFWVGLVAQLMNLSFVNPIGIIHITIDSCEGLIDPRNQMFLRKSGPDTFIEISVGQHEQFFTSSTSIRRRDENPSFKESFQIPIYSSFATIRLTVWHQDEHLPETTETGERNLLKGKRPLGEVILPIKLLSDELTHDIVAQLRPAGAPMGLKGVKVITEATRMVFDVDTSDAVPHNSIKHVIASTDLKDLSVADYVDINGEPLDTAMSSVAPVRPGEQQETDSGAGLGFIRSRESPVPTTSQSSGQSSGESTVEWVTATAAISMDGVQAHSKVDTETHRGGQRELVSSPKVSENPTISSEVPQNQNPSMAATSPSDIPGRGRNVAQTNSRGRRCRNVSMTPLFLGVASTSHNRLPSYLDSVPSNQPRQPYSHTCDLVQHLPPCRINEYEDLTLPSLRLNAYGQLRKHSRSSSLATLRQLSRQGHLPGGRMLTNRNLSGLVDDIPLSSLFPVPPSLPPKASAARVEAVPPVAQSSTGESTSEALQSQNNPPRPDTRNADEAPAMATPASRTTTRSAVAPPTVRGPVLHLSGAFVRDYGLGKIHIQAKLTFDSFAEMLSHWTRYERPPEPLRAPFSVPLFLHNAVRVYNALLSPFVKAGAQLQRLSDWEDAAASLTAVFAVLLWWYWPPLLFCLGLLAIIKDSLKKYIRRGLSDANRRIVDRVSNANAQVQANRPDAPLVVSQNLLIVPNAANGPVRSSSSRVLLTPSDMDSGETLGPGQLEAQQHQISRLKATAAIIAGWVMQRRRDMRASNASFVAAPWSNRRTREEARARWLGIEAGNLANGFNGPPGSLSQPQVRHRANRRPDRLSRAGRSDLAVVLLRRGAKVYISAIGNRISSQSAAVRPSEPAVKKISVPQRVLAVISAIPTVLAARAEHKRVEEEAKAKLDSTKDAAAESTTNETGEEHSVVQANAVTSRTGVVKDLVSLARERTAVGSSKTDDERARFRKLKKRLAFANEHVVPLKLLLPTNTVEVFVNSNVLIIETLSVRPFLGISFPDLQQKGVFGKKKGVRRVPSTLKPSNYPTPYERSNIAEYLRVAEAFATERNLFLLQDKDQEETDEILDEATRMRQCKGEYPCPAVNQKKFSLLRKLFKGKSSASAVVKVDEESGLCVDEEDEMPSSVIAPTVKSGLRCTSVPLVSNTHAPQGTPDTPTYFGDFELQESTTLPQVQSFQISNLSTNDEQQTVEPLETPQSTVPQPKNAPKWFDIRDIQSRGISAMDLSGGYRSVKRRNHGQSIVPSVLQLLKHPKRATMRILAHDSGKRKIPFKPMEDNEAEDVAVLLNQDAGKANYFAPQATSKTTNRSFITISDQNIPNADGSGVKAPKEADYTLETFDPVTGAPVSAAKWAFFLSSITDRLGPVIGTSSMAEIQFQLETLAFVVETLLSGLDWTSYDISRAVFLILCFLTVLTAVSDPRFILFNIFLSTLLIKTRPVQFFFDFMQSYVCFMTGSLTRTARRHAVAFAPGGKLTFIDKVNFGIAWLMSGGRDDLMNQYSAHKAAVYSVELSNHDVISDIISK